jgi:preprotein translocase subunit SecA
MSFIDNIQSFFARQGSQNEIKKLISMVQSIDALEPAMQALSDTELQAKTIEFKDKIAHGASLDSLLVQAFAVVREASWRVLKKRHFSVQLLGGIVLHQGKIAEMKTGEGKTLTATAPVYLNALSGEPVHVVTVNEYLAEHQLREMEPLYNFLGLTTSCVLNKQSTEEKQEAYEADIVYSTNNELGFDYLRDNMTQNLEGKTQRGHAFVIVDEVDSILIDEARTPLIISGPTELHTQVYKIANKAIRTLKKDIDYSVDLKSRSVALTEQGMKTLETKLNIEVLYAPENHDLIHAIQNCLKAHATFVRDQHYVVQQGQVILVDEHTGRLMPGRRFSDGLHQGLEIKEGVEIQPDNQTMAQITLQNFFKLYDKLSGMTGTALTEAKEFEKIYGLSVVAVPTHRTMIRIDEDDELYLKQSVKFTKIVEEIERVHSTGQPILVGTASIEKSELLSKMLDQKKIPHQVLNAKQHASEAEIIRFAGHQGKITIATNMAGRGTDIILGPGVAELGGLYVLGTERHDSRRIDLQLRGRAGRQGDPGRSKFFISWEDDLMKRFNNKANQFLMDKFLGDEVLTDPALNKMINNIQQKVESYYYDQRKQVLEYDNVLNQQRSIVYKFRDQILEEAPLDTFLFQEGIPLMASNIANRIWKQENAVLKNTGRTLGKDDAWDTTPENLIVWEKAIFSYIHYKIPSIQSTYFNMPPSLTWSAVQEYTTQILTTEMESRIELLKKRDNEEFIYQVVLFNMDNLWKEHMEKLDELRDSTSLKSYAQKDPLQEYKQQSYNLFTALLDSIKQSSATRILQTPILKNPQELQPSK